MPKSSKKKVTEEASSDKISWKAYAIFFAVLVAAFVIIWFVQQAFATETTISQMSVTIDGQLKTLKFSQKTKYTKIKDRGYTTLNLGYYLELRDSATHTSLHKIRFTSPVDEIQHEPQMIPTARGDVWIVSTSDSPLVNEGGFVLRFTVNGSTIEPVDFPWDEKYRVRKIQGSKVILSAPGTKIAEDRVFLDLETGKIEDRR